MHELALCQALLSQVESIVAQHEAHAVRSVTLRIGPLSGVEAELLLAAYPLASRGTVAEGSDLLLEAMPVRVRCDRCGMESDALPNRLLCACCGDWHTRIVSGDEMLLASVELITRTS